MIVIHGRTDQAGVKTARMVEMEVARHPISTIYMAQAQNVALQGNSVMEVGKSSALALCHLCYAEPDRQNRRDCRC